MDRMITKSCFILSTFIFKLICYLSKDEETAIKAGMRHGKPVLYHVMAKRMYEDGYKFFISANCVWLTKKVPVRYLKRL